MANLTPAQKAVVKAMLGTFGSPSSLTTPSALKAGPMMRDTSMGMTAPTGPTLGSRPVISEPRPIGDLSTKHIMYWPGVGEARNPDPFAHLKPSGGTIYYPGDPSGYGYNALSGDYELKQPGQAYTSVPAPKVPPRQAVAAINGAVKPNMRGGSLFPRLAIMRSAIPPANQVALDDFDPNAILLRSQDPATRAIAARRQGIPGTGGQMLAPQRPAGVTVVDQLRAQGMKPQQAYDAANAAARQRAAAAAGRQMSAGEASGSVTGASGALGGMTYSEAIRNGLTYG